MEQAEIQTSALGMHSPSPKRRVLDMAPLVRRPGGTAVAPAEAGRLLGMGKNSVFKLAHLGAVEIVADSGGHHLRMHTVHLAPGATPAAIYADWVARVRRWNHRTAVRHKEMRSLCGIPEAEPQPDGLDDFVVATFAATGNVSRDETVAFYMDRGRAAKDRDRIRARLAGTGVGKPGSGIVGPIAAELAAVRFPKLAGLPRTCLAKGAEDEFARPDGRQLARAMRLGPLAPHATMFCLVAGAALRHPRQLRNYVRAFTAVDCELTALGHDDASSPDAIAEALGALLTEAAQKKAGAMTAVSACALFRIATRALRRYAYANDPDGKIGLACFVPAIPKDDERIFQRQWKSMRRNRASGMARRKRLSDRVSDDVERHARVAKYRLEQIVQTCASAAAAKDDLAKHLALRDAMPADRQAGTPAFVEFIVPTTVLDARGGLQRDAAQECVWWAWRERDLWFSLERNALRRQRGQSLRRRSGKRGLEECAKLDSTMHDKIRDARTNPKNYANVVFEYRGRRAAPGTVATAHHEPFFVTMARFGIDTAPSHLSARRQRQRHRLIQSWNLPGRAGLPSGLLSPSDGRTVLHRWVSARNRLVVALDEMLPAYRIADLAFTIVLETLCRIGEALQISQHPDDWDDDTATGKSILGFLARPKGRRGQALPERSCYTVCERTFVEVMELADLLAKAAGHADGWLPAIAPAEGIGPRLPEPKPWVFQWDGKPIDQKSLGYLISSLLANRGRISPHLLRHAGANLLRQLGVPERVVQAILRHASSAMTEYYARETLKQTIRAQAKDGRTARMTVAEALGRVDPATEAA